MGLRNYLKIGGKVVSAVMHRTLGTPVPPQLGF